MVDTNKDIRKTFVELLRNYDGVSETLEILGASFKITEPVIFGAIDEDYAKRELEWYNSMSLSVLDIPGTTPTIWCQVASDSGKLINSNYGYLMFSEDNHNQYLNVLGHLKKNKNTRQAVAIYTRPEIHGEWNTDGMSDFICTNAVHYEIRDNKLHTVVQMRSNDGVFGFKNDVIWQKYVATQLLSDLMSTYPLLEIGEMIWQVASFHIYKRHFYLIDSYSYSKRLSIKKSEYRGKWV